MSEILNIAEQLKAAANKILAEIKIIDSQIAELKKQRDVITSTKVSRDDFLAYLKATFAIKAQSFELMLLREALPKLRFDFGSLERGYDAKNNFLGFYPLTATVNLGQTVFSEYAPYFYFGDIILEKIGKSLAAQFDNQAMPVSELRQALLEIEQTEKNLLQKRTELVAMIDDAGIARN